MYPKILTLQKDLLHWHLIILINLYHLYIYLIIYSATYAVV